MLCEGFRFPEGNACGDSVHVRLPRWSGRPRGAGGRAGAEPPRGAGWWRGGRQEGGSRGRAGVGARCSSQPGAGKDRGHQPGQQLLLSDGQVQISPTHLPVVDRSRSACSRRAREARLGGPRRGCEPPRRRHDGAAAVHVGRGGLALDQAEDEDACAEADEGGRDRVQGGLRRPEDRGRAQERPKHGEGPGSRPLLAALLPPAGSDRHARRRRHHPADGQRARGWPRRRSARVRGARLPRRRHLERLLAREGRAYDGERQDRAILPRRERGGSGRRGGEGEEVSPPPHRAHVCDGAGAA
mmetsp:Transcript_48061/g.150994  ORF Transcript_48061/g.150994 Transcript_48061/m.150994 type:complete len:299 (+) Transcript_48061:24-920(+)